MWDRSEHIHPDEVAKPSACSVRAALAAMAFVLALALIMGIIVITKL